MKITKTASKTIIKLSKTEWEKIGITAGWKKDKDINVESKKKVKDPTQHGFIEDCIKENKDKDNPGAYCASIVDKAKGTTSWRKKK